MNQGVARPFPPKFAIADVVRGHLHALLSDPLNQRRDVDAMRLTQDTNADVRWRQLLAKFRLFALHSENLRTGQDRKQAQEQIAAMGGPSTASMRQIEAGAQTNYRQHTLYGLDRALGWSPGSHLSVLAGRDPHVLIPAEQFRSKIAHAIEGAGTVVVEHQDVPVLRRDPDIERVLRALRRVGEENARNAAELNDALVALARALGQDE